MNVSQLQKKKEKRKKIAQILISTTSGGWSMTLGSFDEAQLGKLDEVEWAVLTPSPLS